MEELVLNEKTRRDLGGSFIELSDGWTHYELTGDESAKTIVLVHGNAVPMLSWDKNVRSLIKAGYSVLRYDIYGHGFSDRPYLKTYDKSLYDRQLTELIYELDINKPFYMAGTSQGGSIAASFVANHPGKVSKLALLAPLFDEFVGKKVAGLIKSRFGDFLMSIAKDKAFTNTSRVFVSDVFAAELKDKLKAQLRFEGKRRAILANMRGDTFDNPVAAYIEMKKQELPIFLSWGELDESIPRRSIERLRALIPDVEYHFIKRAGHLAHYEFADVINPLLIKFFKTN